MNTNRLLIVIIILPFLLLSGCAFVPYPEDNPGYLSPYSYGDNDVYLPGETYYYWHGFHHISVDHYGWNGGHHGGGHHDSHR